MSASKWNRLTALTPLLCLIRSTEAPVVTCHTSHWCHDSLHTPGQLISCSGQSPGLQCPCAGIFQLIPHSGHSLTHWHRWPGIMTLWHMSLRVTSTTMWNKAPALAHSCDANFLRNFTQNIASAVTIDLLPNLEPLMLSDEPWHVCRLEIRHKIASSLETSLIVSWWSSSIDHLSVSRAAVCIWIQFPECSRSCNQESGRHESLVRPHQQQSS